MWLHVDGAYGGFFCLLLEDFKVKGLERADSITLDGHKSLFLALTCSLLVVK